MKGKLYIKALEFKNKIVHQKIDTNYNFKVSVIIPVFYAKHLEKVILHLTKISDIDEIILVDDSGEFSKENYYFIKQYCNIKLYYHQKNLGRSAARNTGASKASNDILLFMDQDMFLSPLFINDALKYFQSNNSLIYLGQRETVTIDLIPHYENWKSLNINLDWRVETSVSNNFIDLTVSGCGKSNNNLETKNSLSLYKQSNKLKNLGVDPKSTIGFWDLPSMVISHSMAVTKKDYLELGGFPEWIKGWGGEDIVFGFLACARHIPIHLSNSVSFQAEHAPYSGSIENNLNELKNNINYYREWATNVNEFPIFNHQKIKLRGIQFNF